MEGDVESCMAIEINPPKNSGRKRQIIYIKRTKEADDVG